MQTVVLENLSKTFSGGKKAVKDVSLSLEKGEVFGFLGPNGAGKTTTVKLLNGMLVPSEGRCSVMGYDPVRDPEKKLEKFYAFSGSGEAREKLPASLLLSAGSFLDLILMSGAAERGSLRLHIRKPYELSYMKL